MLSLRHLLRPLGDQMDLGAVEPATMERIHHNTHWHEQNWTSILYRPLYTVLAPDQGCQQPYLKRYVTMKVRIWLYKPAFVSANSGFNRLAPREWTHHFSASCRIRSDWGDWDPGERLFKGKSIDITRAIGEEAILCVGKPRRLHGFTLAISTKRNSALGETVVFSAGVHDEGVDAVCREIQ